MSWNIPFHQKEPMKLLGFLLLVSGWGIVETAFYLLHGNALPAFIIAGLGVEILGLVLVTRAHLPSTEESR